MNLPRGKPASDRDVPRVGSVLGLAYTHRHSPPWLCVVPFFFLSSTEQPYHQTELERRNGARPHQGDVARACFSRLRFNPHRPWQTLCAIRLIRLLLRSALLLLVCVCMHVTSQSKIGAGSECVPTIGAILSSSSNPGCAHDQSAIISTKA